MKIFLNLSRRILIALVLISALFSATSTLAAPNQGVTVQSVRRMDPNPTGAEIVRFTVTFSSPVIDVDMGDFGITTTGDISGVFLSGVSGSGKTRTVSVNTGTGNGTIRLDVIDNDTIESTGGAFFERAFYGGETYTIEKGPVVTSVTLLNPNPTNADSVKFAVAFSESMIDVGLSDYTLTTTGDISGTSITDIQGTGAAYTVTVTTGSGTGSIRLDVIDNDTMESSSGAYFNSPYSSGEVYIIDKVLPAVSSITMSDSALTNAETVDFVVTFPKDVKNVDLADFTFITTGKISDASIEAVSGSGNTYTVTVYTGTGIGTIRLGVINNHTIVDLFGNPFDNPYFGGPSFPINRDGPTVSSVSRLNPSSTSAAIINYQVIFSKEVIDVDITTFALFTTGEINGAALMGVSGSGDTYTISVNTGSGDGNIRLDVIDIDAIEGLDGTFFDTPFHDGEEYVIDKSSPVARIEKGSSSVPGVKVFFNVVFNEPVTGFGSADLLISGMTDTPEIVIAGSGTTYIVEVTGMVEGETITAKILPNAVEDLTGNVIKIASSSDSKPPDGIFAPFVLSVTRVDPNPTSADQLTFKVTFSTSVIDIDSGDFSPTITGGVTGSSVTEVSGSGDSYFVTVDTGLGVGTVRLDVIDNNTIEDLDGNYFESFFFKGEAYSIE